MSNETRNNTQVQNAEKDYKKMVYNKSGCGAANESDTGMLTCPSLKGSIYCIQTKHNQSS